MLARVIFSGKSLARMGGVSAVRRRACCRATSSRGGSRPCCHRSTKTNRVRHRVASAEPLVGGGVQPS
eukprot:8026179-Pyramimonas_sp.AAC.1